MQGRQTLVKMGHSQRSITGRYLPGIFSGYQFLKKEVFLRRKPNDFMGWKDVYMEKL